MKNDKLIKLRIFLEVKNVVTKFLNSLVYRENPKKDDFSSSRTLSSSRTSKHFHE